ncbi:MAG: hypothetical protein TQ37_02895 [Candidatus Synechococcus spongiarum 15L]|uniref:Uncharacterized protein n=1 Tax=Candidatus Synechococcus spongiarum 15L TaxID=1608419 RepID=A0A0G8AWW8_9SYNE|nr:MAG: hypothetical protein TQ37_02895 [Candidatus Synechococcus spongiarum 15L]
MVVGVNFGTILHKPQRHRELPVHVEAWLQGTFHKIRPKHLDRYVSEFAGRHTVRLLDTVDIMVGMVAGMMGNRLKHQELLA